MASLFPYTRSIMLMYDGRYYCSTHSLCLVGLFSFSTTGNRCLLTGTCQSRVTTALYSHSTHLSPGTAQYLVLVHTYVVSSCLLRIHNRNYFFSSATRRRATKLETHGARAYATCAREHDDACAAHTLWPPCCEHVCKFKHIIYSRATRAPTCCCTCNIYT